MFPAGRRCRVPERERGGAGRGSHQTPAGGRAGQEQRQPALVRKGRTSAAQPTLGSNSCSNQVVMNCRWKIHEACMLSLGSVKTIITENVKNNRIQFDMQGFLAGVILADLNLAGERRRRRPRDVWRPIKVKLVSSHLLPLGFSEQQRRRSCWAGPCGRPVASPPPCLRTSSSSFCRPPSAASTKASRRPSASRRSEPSGGE